MEHATRSADQATSGFGGTIAGLGKNILTTAAGFFTAQAAFAAVKSAISALGDELKTLTLHGAAVADVSENFEHLTQTSGRLGTTLLGSLREGTHGTIADFDLMKLATQDLAAGLNLTDQQFGTLSKGAFALAQATGGDVATALETMNDAMLTGRTRALALLTGKIDLEKAETNFAKSLGVTREHLSEEGKLEAARAAILAGVGTAIERLGVQTDGLDEKVAQAQAAWANFQNELGRTVATSPVIMAGLDGISDALTEAFGTDKSALVKSIAMAIDDAAIAVIGFAKAAISTAGFVVTEWYAVKKVYGDVRQVIDGLALATLYLGKAQLALPNAVGIGTAAWKKNDEAIQGLLVSMKARGAQLQADDAAQKSVTGSTKVYISALEKVESSMKAAKVSTAAHAVAVLSGTTALGTASIAMGAHTNLVKEDTKAMTARAKIVVERFAIEARAADALRQARKYFADEEEKAFAASHKVLTKITEDYYKNQEEIAFATSKNILQNRVKDFERMNEEIQTALSVGAKVKIGPSFAQNLFEGFGPTIIRAFEGGGNVLKSIGATLGGNLTQHIFGKDSGMSQKIMSTFGPALGGAFNALLPGIGALAGPLLDKLAGLFAGIFGGPSGTEREGRSAADAFRASLASTLDWQKQIEVHQLVAAGNSEKWATTVVALREAYLKAGHSVDEALDATNRLWEAEKKGGGAVQKVIDEIVTAMHDEMPAAAREAARSIDDAAGDISHAFDDVIVTVRNMRDLISEPIDVQVNYLKQNTQQSEGARQQAGGRSYEQQLADFLEKNPGDIGRAAEAIGNVPGYASGTGGRYMDFGAGTLAMLHGREKVVPEGSESGGLTIGAITVNVSGSGKNAEDIAREIAPALITEIRRNYQGTRSQLVALLGTT